VVEGSARKRTTFCSSAEPTYLDRYEVYVDERNTAQEEDVTDAEYLEILKSSGAEHLGTAENGIGIRYCCFFHPVSVQ